MKKTSNEKKTTWKNKFLIGLRIVVLLALGISFLAWPDQVIKILPLLLGYLLILEALSKIIRLIPTWKKGYPNWWMPLITSLLVAVPGFVIIFRSPLPFTSLLRLLGLGLLFDGLVEIWVQIAKIKASRIALQKEQNANEDALEEDTSPLTDDSTACDDKPPINETTPSQDSSADLDSITESPSVESSSDSSFDKNNIPTKES